MLDLNEDSPVLVILDKDGYLLQIGHPYVAKPKELAMYIKEGCSMQTMPLKEYKAKNYTWIWDKPKS